MPDLKTQTPTPFGHSFSGETLFTRPQTSHSLTFASLQLIEMSKGLIDATLDSVAYTESLR